MKLLLDQGVPRSAAALLVSDGHDAVHVGDVGLSAAADAQVLSAARNEQRTVVTLDADFHAIMARTGATDPSVIWIRTEVCKLLPWSPS
jgi:predicted nuclease of predicted toxin-antitoxin system